MEIIKYSFIIRDINFIMVIIIANIIMTTTEDYYFNKNQVIIINYIQFIKIIIINYNYINYYYLVKIITIIINFMENYKIIIWKMEAVAANQLIKSCCYFIKSIKATIAANINSNNFNSTIKFIIKNNYSKPNFNFNFIVFATMKIINFITKKVAIVIIIFELEIL